MNRQALSLIPDAPPVDAATRARLQALSHRLAALVRLTADFWLEHGVDHEHGGFHGTLDRRGEPVPPTDKALVQQARHLFTFSTYYERRAQEAAVRAICDSTFRLIDRRFRVEGADELVHAVTREGEISDEKHQLYAQAFAIFGISTYGRVFAIEPAVDAALRCFRSIDARAHDRFHGGYDQRDDPGWLSPGAGKETNTHIHLMEAFTALAEASGDREVHARLEELATIVATRLLQADGYVHPEFLPDFTPFGARVVSYGHDLETAWLLLDAARVLGRPTDSNFRRAAIEMGLPSAERGFDAEHGGYFLEGEPGALPRNLEKVWWVQFEALAGLFVLFELTLDPALLARLERTLDWLELHHDAEYGEWFWGILPDGRISSRGDHKGEAWKTSYHSLRALIYTEDWIDAALRR